MKKLISNQHELLSVLAAQGDAAAFFSIITPFIRETYLHERQKGVSHEEATKNGVSVAVALFEKMQLVAIDHLDGWCSEHCTVVRQDGADELAEFLPSKNNPTEVAAFLHICSQYLMRAGSVSAKKNKRHGRSILKNTPRKKGLLITALLLICIGVAVVLFFQSGLKLLVVLKTPHNQFQLQLPPGDRFIANSTQIPTDTLVKRDTVLVIDTVVPKPDTAQAVPVVKKRPIVVVPPKPAIVPEQMVTRPVPPPTRPQPQPALSGLGSSVDQPSSPVLPTVP